jgi:hypothetical protein
MDPKMDSGCVESADELEELYDVTRPLLPEEVLGIIDQLLCHEVSATLTKQLYKLTILLRWHGIRDILFHRLCSLVYTLRRS